MKKLVIVCLALFSSTAFAYPVGEKGVDRMVSHITEELELSEDQAAQVRVIFEDQGKKMKALHEEGKAKMDKVLTEGQRKKMEEMKAGHKKHFKDKKHKSKKMHKKDGESCH